MKRLFCSIVFLWTAMGIALGGDVAHAQNPSTVIKVLDARMVDHSWSTPAGKSHGHGVVSKDGKTMRYTLTGTDGTGKPVHDLDVFEKQ